MSYIKIINDENKYYGTIVPIDDHTIETLNIPKSNNGFELYNDKTNSLIGDYSEYTYNYRDVNNTTYMYTNDGHEYIPPKVEEDSIINETVEEDKNSKISDILSKISSINKRFEELDYIGIKIATGRAIIEEYSTEIEQMKRLAEEKDELENELELLKEE